MIEEELFRRTAGIMKAATLLNQPGHDEVSVKLNSQPTSAEIKQAERWAYALTLADSDVSVWDAAQKVRNLR